MSQAEVEPNDDLTLATVLTGGVAVVGALNSSNDVDVYKAVFSSAGAAYYQFNVGTSTAARQFSLTMSNAKGQILAFAETGADQAYAASIPTAGIYYLSVFKTADWTLNPSNYSITFNQLFVANPQAEIEPNDVPSRAIAMFDQQPLQAQLLSREDVDFYRIDTRSPGTLIYTVSPAFAASGNVFEAVLLDSKAKVLSTASVSSTRSSSLFLDGEGSYYLQIKAGAGFDPNSGKNQYTVEQRFSPLSTVVPKYSISSSTPSVKEGDVARFDIATQSVKPGIKLSYVISGVDADDVLGGKLTGQVQIDGQGNATLYVGTTVDRKTEGDETLKVSLQGTWAEASTTLIDSSYDFLLRIGGDRDDTLTGGTGAERLSGGKGNDLIDAGLGDDWLEGQDGDDTLKGGEGADVIDGGLGVDVAVFSGALTDYVLSKNQAGVVSVSNKQGTTDFLLNIQYLQFDDLRVDTREISYLPGVGPTGYLDDGNAAIYRFYNSRDKAFFYTASIAEKIEVVRESTDPNYKPSTGLWPYFFQGASFASAKLDVAGITPVYRFYNTKTGHHFFTTSTAEKAYIEKESSDPNFGQPGLWPFIYEGIAFDAYLGSSTSSAVPVFRFYNAALDRHFFTASSSEAEEVRRLVGYTDEGVGFWAEGIDPVRSLVGQIGFTLPSMNATDTVWSTAPTPIVRISADKSSVTEGQSVSFTVSTTSTTDSDLSYTLSGSGINAADIVGGVLSGTLRVPASGQRIIIISIAQDSLNEGEESLLFTIQGTAPLAVVIRDFSAPADPPPSLLRVTPDNKATLVDVGTNFTFVFSEQVKRGQGWIELLFSDGRNVERFDVQTSTRLQWSANQLMIDPSVDLGLNQSYRILIPVGAVKDLTGNDYISSDVYTITTIGDSGIDPGVVGGGG